MQAWNGPYNPYTGHRPPWARELGTWEPVPAGKSQYWIRDLSPGTYFMVCAQMQPLLVWDGTGLTVAE